MTPIATPDAVADYLVERIGAPDSEPFLLARVLTDRLRESSALSSDSWRDQIDTTVAQVLEADLAAVEPRASRDPGTARTLLTALTRGYGAGLPEDEWLVIATAMTSAPVDRDDVSEVLTQLGRYVVQDCEAGLAVYRIAHQSFADYLRPPFPASYARPFEPDAIPIARALTAHYRRLLEQGVPADRPQYLWRYLWRHCGVAGQEGLDGLRALIELAPSLRLDLVLAALVAADVFARQRRPLDAVGPTEEAIATLRDLDDTPRLADALDRLSRHYGDAGHPHGALRASQESIALYREFVAFGQPRLPELSEPRDKAIETLGPVATPKPLTTLPMDPDRPDAAATYMPHLASGLVNLSKRHHRLGNRSHALACASEAVALARELSASSSAYDPLLAEALTSLSTQQNAVEDREDAVLSGLEAAELYERCAEKNPIYQAEQAEVLTELSALYRDLDDAASALIATRTAAELGRQLAANDAVYLPQLARTLLNLSQCYLAVDQPSEAVPAAEEARKIRRKAAKKNATGLPDLATALANLGDCYRAVGRPAAARGVTEEAIDVYRVLAMENPAHLPALAGELGKYDLYCSQLDEPDAIEEIWRDTLAQFHGADVAILLLFRSLMTQPGDPDAVAWLRTALDTMSLPRTLVADLHTEARRHRRSWPHPIPAWLVVDHRLLTTASGWARTPTFTAERDYLAAHSELLEVNADVAVAEALLGLDQPEAKRLRFIRTRAQLVGVREAYQPVLLASLVNDFIEAAPRRQRDLLQPLPGHAVEHGRGRVAVQTRRGNHVRCARPGQSVRGHLRTGVTGLWCGRVGGTWS